MRICQNCKTKNVEESVFCKSCGTKIEDNPFICPECLFENTEDSSFCIKCGTKVGGSTAKATIASAASNREAGFNQETTQKANTASSFDYNVYMNGSPVAETEEKQVDNINFNYATASQPVVEEKVEEEKVVEQPVEPVQIAKPVQPVEAVQVAEPVVRTTPVQEVRPVQTGVEVSNTAGNTVGNIVNEGVVARQGDWIYFSNSGDKGTLYKEKLDGSDKTKVSDEVCFCINVVEDWIYYRNNSDGGKLYKIRIDGTERTKMLDDSVDCVSVVDSVIYFVNYSDDKKLYKINVDGSGKLRICDDKCMYINVVDGWVYYCNLTLNQMKVCILML